MKPAIFPGDAEVVTRGERVRDVRCFCTEVVTPSETSVLEALTALARHLQEPVAHGGRFANATADDLSFEPPDPNGRARIRWRAE